MQCGCQWSVWYPTEQDGGSRLVREIEGQRGHVDGRWKGTGVGVVWWRMEGRLGK